MTELLTSAQMRAIEAAAIASGDVTGLELMERAGKGVVEAILEEWPALAAGASPGALPRTPEYFSQDEARGALRAVVMCGPGNNGGDGFVIARLLKERGWEVEVFLYGDPERLPTDARVNYEKWREIGEVSSILNPLTINAMTMKAGEHGVLIDAVFGTGLSRPLEEDLRLALGGFLSRVPIRFLRPVAVDIPSGICSDSGRPLIGARGFGLEWHYDLVVTFHRFRIGHHLHRRSNKVVVKDLGLDATRIGKPSFPPDLLAKLATFGEAAEAGADAKSLINWDAEIASARKFHEAEVAKVELLDGFDAMIDKAESGPVDHKYSHGHALVLAGGAGRGGAARLAARGALRIGAGVVTVGCPLEAMAENAARLDAVMLRGVADGAGLAEVLEDARINGLCLGPGMGTGAREAGLVAAALEGRGSRRLVLDADALTILSQHPGLFAALHDGCVLTPHAGEFARLFPDIAEKLAAPATKGPAYSKVDATREAAARAGCVVLYKGPDTVIADPTGRCAINSALYDRAAPWLATAGSGDVLAGFITGLLARGFSPFNAACTGAWLHVECARSFGPGLIAEDIAEEVPKVFRRLGL